MEYAKNEFHYAVKYKQQIKASSFYRGRFEHGYCVHKNPESQYTDKRSSVPSVIMDANAKIDGLFG